MQQWLRLQASSAGGAGIIPGGKLKIPHARGKLFIFVFFLKFFFNWRIIALQHCVSFCHTSTWISHKYTYVPSLLNLPPASQGCHRAPSPSSLHHIPTNSHQIPTANSHWLSVLYMVMDMFQCYFFNSSLSCPHCVHKSVLYVCVSIASLQIKIRTSVPVL